MAEQRIVRLGVIELPKQVRTNLFVVSCSNDHCPMVCSARTERAVIDALSEHLVYAHETKVVY